MVTAEKPHSVHTIVITSLEQNVWDDVRAHIALSLNRLKLEQLAEPTYFLLYQLVSKMVNLLHCDVFKRTVQIDLGIDFDDVDSENELNMLFHNELAEHGDQNIARFCQLNQLHIVLSFCSTTTDTIVTISAPECCQDALQIGHKVMKTLGYVFKIQNPSDTADVFTVELVKNPADQHTYVQPVFISPQNECSSYQEIFAQTSCGIVHFSNIGTIQTISPSIFALLDLNVDDTSLETFGRSIPMHFYSDVIWGIALQEPNGKFENYRVRIQISDDIEQSALFTVSGFRADDTTIHTLWQKISLHGGNTNKLSEGDLLNEVRVHNITRNYVPQLVEKKAREVVRLGGNKLKNEECNFAVLFCDIVGFTEFVEQNEEEESIIHILNSVLRRISLSVKKFGGFIDKFMGDCIMVLFRNPYDAVLAALEMQKHSHDISTLRERAELHKLQLRIGIHWGKVIIGNVGTPERLDWTTIGDVVNTASRIEKNCEPGSVLISEKMREAVVDTTPIHFKYGEIFYISVKGKKEKLAVCYTFPID